MKTGMMLVCPKCEAIQSTQHEDCVSCGASLEAGQLIQPLPSDSAAEADSRGLRKERSSSTPFVPKKPLPALAVGASVGLLLAVVAVLTRLDEYPLPQLLAAAAIGWVVWTLLIAGFIGLARSRSPGKAIAVIIVAVAACVAVPIIILGLPGYENTTPDAPAATSTTSAFTAPTRAQPTTTQGVPPWWRKSQEFLAMSRADQSALAAIAKPTAPSPVSPQKATATLPPRATNTPSYDPQSAPGSWKQTVTAIDNRLSTAAAQGTVEEQNAKETPTPMTCLSEASISEPRHSSTVRGSVKVFGTASIPGFQYYKLEYSTLPQPSSSDWITIGELHDQPVTNSMLAVWESSALPAGQCWLRLVAVDQTGNFPEPCVIRVRIADY